MLGEPVSQRVEVLERQAAAMKQHAERLRAMHAPTAPVWVDPSGRRVRMYQDHVLVLLKPLDEVTSSGIALVRNRATVVKEPRRARVLAVGPGYHAGCRHCGVSKHFVPTSVRVGEEVLIPFLAGADWSLDRTKPRHMPQGVEFAIHDERFNNYGESQLIGDLRLSNLRVLKEEEILGVIDPDGPPPIPSIVPPTEDPL